MKKEINANRDHPEEIDQQWPPYLKIVREIASHYNQSPNMSRARAEALLEAGLKLHALSPIGISRVRFPL